MDDNIAICTHSTNNDYIIFSVARNKNTNQDNIAHTIALTYLDIENISYKEIEGCYSGTTERSYIVNAKHKQQVFKLTNYYEQESVLVLKSHKHGLYKASLVYNPRAVSKRASNHSNALADLEAKDLITNIGYLREVPKEQALENTNYSYRKDLDKYFIVTDNDDTRVGQTTSTIN